MECLLEIVVCAYPRSLCWSLYGLGFKFLLCNCFDPQFPYLQDRHDGSTSLPTTIAVNIK